MIEAFDRRVSPIVRLCRTIAFSAGRSTSTAPVSPLIDKWSYLTLAFRRHP